MTNLSLNSTTLFFIAINTNLAADYAAIAGLDATPLSKIFLSLLLSDFDLLFLATTAQLIWFELILSFELRPTMLGNVAVRHGGCLGRRYLTFV